MQFWKVGALCNFFDQKQETVRSYLFLRHLARNACDDLLQACDIFLRGHGFRASQHADDGNKKCIGEKVGKKGILPLPRKERVKVPEASGLQKSLKYSAKEFCPRIGERVYVKRAVRVKIRTERIKKFPAGGKGPFPVGLNKLRFKDPADQIVFIAEMIIKAFAAHAAGSTDIAYTDALKRLFRHQPLHGGCKRKLGDV